MVRGEEGPRRPDPGETLRPQVDRDSDTEDGAPGVGPRPPGIPGHDVGAQMGRGGFATVWRAHQRSVGRTVAVKVLDHRVLDDEALARFQLEVATLAQLSWNPNTVHVYDVGTTDDGRPFVSMEWMSGGSLAARVTGSGPLPTDEVVRIGLALTDAVEAAHASGVLHRDVKPENVLVNHRGDAKLADFGVARLAGTTTSIAGGAFRGTVLHAAPELLDGAEPSYASDVWGIGSTLYFLCAGRAPFAREGAGDDSVTGIIRRTLLEPPAALPDDVPPALATMILDCLAKDPADRPSDTRELQQRLATIDLDDHTAAGPAPAANPARTDVRRQRRAAMIAVAAVAVLAIVGVGWSVGLGGDRFDDDTEAAADATTATTDPATTDPPPPDTRVDLPEDGRMPPLPTRVGVSRLVGRDDVEDRSPELRAALDRFAATSELPGVADAIGSTDIDPATLDLTEVPAVFDFVAVNAENAAACRRVLLPHLHLDGQAARIWSDGNQIVLANTVQFATELDSRRYFHASALNLGLEPDHCDGWPADGVATHLDIEHLRVDRTDFSVDPSTAPDRIVTTVTRDALLGGTEVERSYQMLAQIDDVIALAVVGGVSDGARTSPQDAAAMLDDLLRALAG